MKFLSFILVTLLIIIGITFATLNAPVVPINYYLGETSFPLSMLLATSFALGAAAGMLVGLWMIMKLKVKNMRLKQKLSLAEREVENLRAIPLQDKD